jgi:hypothetical protein
VFLIYTNERKSYIQLLNEALIPDSDGTIEWFFREDALEVFLKYHMFDVHPGSGKNFAKKWEVFYFGAGGLNKYHPEQEGYDKHIAMPFYCRSFIRNFISDHKNTAYRADDKPRFEKWSHFCREHKGWKYFMEDMVYEFNPYITDSGVNKHLAKVIFSKEYVAKIKEILYREIFLKLENDRNLWMRFLKGMCKTDSEKEICRFVAACFHQYKKIKEAIDTNSPAPYIESLCKRFLDVECRLRSKLDNKRAPLSQCSATKFSEFTGNPVFVLMQDFLSSMKADIGDVLELKKFNNPIYWAPAPISDEEGADILKELEEQEDNHPAFVVYEDAPNAFLEQID